MRAAGFAGIAIGLVLLIVSVLYDTTVESSRSVDLPGLGGTDFSLPSQTHNLGLLQTQMMLLHTGLALIVTGSILAAVGELIRRLEEAGVLKPSEGPTAQVTTASSCNWCGRRLPAGSRTCTSYDSETLARVANKVRDPVCKQQLQQRGFTVAPDA